MKVAIKRSAIEKLPGLICQGHYFEVPLDYQKSSGSSITVYAREIVTPENASKNDLPWLLYLQGGPGFPSPRPEGSDGWLKRALKDHRVVLLDQRGTGLSSPVTHETLALMPNAQSQFEYLKHFRADNIVRDCESMRKILTGGQPWKVLGQSFGGFCIASYLSLAPQGMSGAIITGGLPPLACHPDDVYRATYKKLIEKNKLFYECFPTDVELVSRIVDHLQENVVVLPTREILSVRRFLQMGINFGFAGAGRSMNTVHYLLESAFLPTPGAPRLSYSFLRALDNMISYNTNPIYSLLHESIYCQNIASNWSAQRVLAEFPEFDPSGKPVFFTGEMIYPWMFDEYECLKPLSEVAELLANCSNWTTLYDAEVLKANIVPTVACVYYNDMYVDRQLSEQTANNIGAIKLWITNEYEHDGLRQDGEKILDRLLSMLTDDCQVKRACIG